MSLPAIEFADSTATDDARTWRDPIGRAGLLARGVLYVVLGYLAGQFAFGDVQGAKVSDAGAAQFVLQRPLGEVMLWVLTLGLVAMALWQFLTAATGDPVKGDDVTDRAKFVVKGGLYAFTAWTAFKALGVGVPGNGGSGGGAGGGGGGESSDQAAAFLMGLPGGRWIVAALGLGILFYAAKTIKDHAVDARFMQRIRSDRMDHDVAETVEKLGRYGYAIRGAVIGLTGLFFVVAAVQAQPDESRGLGGSLVELSQQPFGTWLLGAVAIGLVLYGSFSMLESKYRVAA